MSLAAPRSLRRAVCRPIHPRARWLIIFAALLGGCHCAGEPPKRDQSRPHSDVVVRADGCLALAEELRQGKVVAVLQRELGGNGAASDLHVRLGLPDHAAAASYLREAAYYLLECEAVRADDEAPCVLVDDPKDRKCAERVFGLRRLRKPAAGRAWRVPPEVIALCAERAGREVCEQARDAVIAGDPERCPEALGPGRSHCQAYATLDLDYCDGEEECVKEVTRFQRFEQGGLAAVAAEEEGLERIMFDAALGTPDACAPLVEEFRAACTAHATPAPPG